MWHQEAPRRQNDRGQTGHQEPCASAAAAGASAMEIRFRNPLHYLLITPTESLVLLHDDALSEAQDAELFGWHVVLRQSHLQYHGRFVEGFIGEAERSPMTGDRLPRLHVQMDLYC